MSPPSHRNPPPFVLLDRDGVINQDSVHFILRPEEWVPIPGSLAAIAALTRMGVGVVVLTNQSAIGRGLMSTADLERIHRRMRDAVEEAGGRISAIYYCPHAPEAGCDCRKPKPGLFLRFAEDFGVPLAGLPALGDSLRDLEAAQQAGARPVLVLTGNGARTRASLAGSPLEGVEIVPDLATFVASLEA